jgi:hypothetical protein
MYKLKIITILFIFYSCKTGPNYYVKITPSTINGRQKIVSKEIKRMERKMKRVRRLKQKNI